MHDDEVIENAVLAVFAEAAGVDQSEISLQTTFSELSVDSLDMTEAIISLEDKLGRETLPGIEQEILRNGDGTLQEVVTKFQRLPVMAPPSFSAEVAPKNRRRQKHNLSPQQLLGAAPERKNKIRCGYLLTFAF